jgi:hypothetical protein
MMERPVVVQAMDRITKTPVQVVQALTDMTEAMAPLIKILERPTWPVAVVVVVVAQG